VPSIGKLAVTVPPAALFPVKVSDSVRVVGPFLSNSETSIEVRLNTPPPTWTRVIVALGSWWYRDADRS
jgi:hypothetical protein